MRPTHLRCEYLTDPLGIDTPTPRLSWVPPFDQAAYQIKVTGLWDSGCVRSAESLHVQYAGPTLQPRRRYVWRVRCWNRRGEISAWSGPACWTTGLAVPGWQQPQAWDQPHSATDTTMWVGGPGDSPTMVRRSFTLAHRPRQALLFATALGAYETSLNGQRVGDQVLAPE